MRAAVISAFAVLVFAHGAAATTRYALGLSASISAHSAAPVTKQDVFNKTHRYKVTVEGTASAWCPPTAKAATDCSYGSPLQIGEGQDALYCYAAWHENCKPPSPAGMLHLNGVDFATFSGQAFTYDASHTYSAEVSGLSGDLTLTIADSVSDDSGKFTVTVEDLGSKPAPGAQTTEKEPAPSAAVKKLQSELAKLGLYTGPLDGRLNLRTKASIKSFQRDVGIPIDGNCGVRCLAALKQALGLDDPALPAGATPTSRSTVTELQSDLAKLGLYRGPLDGRYDEGVTAAVKRFQLQAGIAADGKCELRCQLAIVDALTP